MKQICWLTCILLLSFSQTSFALRCGHDLVVIGDYKEDVYDICGEPESVHSHTEIRGGQSYAGGNRNFGNSFKYYPDSSFNYGQNNFRQVEVIVEEWVYDFGRSRLRQYLRFENGQLVEIKTIGRGR